MTKTPYDNQTQKHFWSNFVRNSDSDVITDLWNPKFEINKWHKIATAGSCFAQNIGNWLSNNDYNWIQTNKDVYKSPFSFYTGNIYTASSLKQWLLFASNKKSLPNDLYFEYKNKFYDLYRPSVLEIGYNSIDDLNKSYKQCLNSIISGLKNADIFIFTLGLTEHWRNKDGYIYTTCPGTQVGIFDYNYHEYYNDEYIDIYNDMIDCIELLKSFNSKIKIILTVSPVPLTATASDLHILQSTTYSKSVLRSVCGDLAKKHDNIDYFPSYELITNHVLSENTFMNNKRTVSRASIDRVMKNFKYSIETKISEKNNSYTNIMDYNEEFDEICDEIKLEQYNRININNINDKYKTNICLIGDSHMGLLSKQFHNMDVEHFGGMIMNGSGWAYNKFAIDEEEFFVPLEGTKSRILWQNTLPFFELKVSDKIIITNIGIQSQIMVPNFLNNFYDTFTNLNITSDHVMVCLENILIDKMLLLKKMQYKCKNLIILSDPPLQGFTTEMKNWAPAFNLFDQCLEQYFYKNGLEYFNVRSEMDQKDLSIYLSNNKLPDGENDWFHGNEMYYKFLADLIINKYL